MSASGERPVERLVEAEPRLRVREPREHAHLLLAEPRDLVVEGDEVLLRRLGLGRRARRARAVRRSTSPPRPSRRAISASATSSSSRSTARSSCACRRAQLRRARLELARELAAHVEHAGRGAAELRVLVEPLLDRGLVDGAGVPLLAAADPLGEAPRTRFTSTGDESHDQPPHLVASSALMPSSRIFCWKFCRYMPTSSAALLMLPPWRRSAWTQEVALEGLHRVLLRVAEGRRPAPRRRVGAGPACRAPAARRTGRPPSISGAGGEEQRLLDRRAQLAHVALPGVRDAGAERVAGERLQRRG